MRLRAHRPGVEFTCDCGAEQSLARLRHALTEPSGAITGTVLGSHLQLTVHPRARHYWSPWLIAEVAPSEQGSVIIGRFSPNPAIWTMWAAAYAILACGFAFAALYGVFVLLVEGFTPILLALPVAIILAIALYAGSIVGQSLGMPQMREIHGFLERELEARAVRSPVLDAPDAESANGLN